jgi:hypothetical protein
MNTSDSSRNEAAKFLKAFGERGAVWYSQGLTFDECRGCEAAELRAEIKTCKSRLSNLKKIVGEL